MHLKRWLTGIIALPILAFLIGPGPSWSFCLLIFLVSLAGLMEFYRMTAAGLPKFVRWSNYLLMLLLFLLIFYGKVYFVPAVIVLWAFIPMVLFMFSSNPPGQESSSAIGKALLGPIYVCLPLAMLMTIHRHPQGDLWVFFLLTVIFMSDTGAFYFGRYLGKHKLFEAISPNKTWEGSVGGILSSLFAATVFLRITGLYPLHIDILCLVLALSVIEQIGDLVESMLKRCHGVKDSGYILPGHGGILDRIDGLLFSIPILYIFLW